MKIRSGLFPIMHLDGIFLPATKTAHRSPVLLHQAAEKAALFGEMWGNKYF